MISMTEIELRRGTKVLLSDAELVIHPGQHIGIIGANGGFHRHNSEIDQMLKKFTKKKLNFNFTPHLTPMFRGILSTIYIDLEKDTTQSKIIKTLTDFYKKDDFVKILKANSLLSTNDVINSNNCFISVCKSKYKDKIIIISAIDNLIKGGAGQAVQNLNMKFNFPIKTAL